MIKRAFSLVEIVVALIIFSVITAALAPIITKKLKSNAIAIGNSSANNEIMEVMCANLFGDNCIRCDKEECTKCVSTHYLTTEKTCSSCNAGYFCDGTSSTMPCSNKFGEGCNTCNSTKCLVADMGYYITKDGYTLSCAKQYDPNCAACNDTQCNACKAGYAFNENRQCIVTCMPGSQEFISAGTFSFNVPDGCESITVTLVGGGGGGGAGSIKETQQTFTKVGASTWSVPNTAKNSNFKIYSCGGGGASSSTECGRNGGESKLTNSGGYGGFVNGVIRKMPNKTSIEINVGAGGAGRIGYHWGGYGGGATYLKDFASDAEVVAGGGAGGGCTTNIHGRCGSYGGGDGASTSNGGAANASCCRVQGANGKPNIGSMINYFGTSYCAGGSRSGTCCDCDGVNGKQGILKLVYRGANIGGSGGSAGSIVPKQKINASGKLTVIVGKGGTGGLAGEGFNASGVFTNSTDGAKGEQSMIKSSTGSILLQTSSQGGLGGFANGTVGNNGQITNGKNSTEITAEGFSINTVSNTTTTNGTAGASTLIDNYNYCTEGLGSTAGAGGNATNYGGCGGGGGSSGYNGGNGAPGYVKIEWGNI